MAGQIYFGNFAYQTWIKAPNTGMQAGSAGYISEHQLNNGRKSVKRSRASHRTFSPTWMGSLNSTENSLQTIKNFVDGNYGDGPFYWIDPFAANRNILPPHWANPSLMLNDWPNNFNDAYLQVITDKLTVKDLPKKYLSIQSIDDAANGFLRLIIPEGYTLHFGWFRPDPVDSGDIANPIRIMRYSRSTGNFDYIEPAYLDARDSSSALTNVAIDGDDYNTVALLIDVPVLSRTKITAMFAQILPSTAPAPTGDFIHGMGTTALEFASFPQIEYYSANVNNGQVGMSVSLVEVD